MQLRNTETQFGAVTKALHWTIALLIIFMLGLGLWMGDLPMGVQKLQAVTLHKSIGITVLVLMLCRVVWHLVFSHRPREADTLKPIDKAAAAAMHYTLYVLALAIPLAGWAMSSAKGRSVSVFGLFTLPDIAPKNNDLGELLETCHNTMAYILIALVSLHVLAALKHHFVEKDTVLKRMLPMLVLATLLTPSVARADAPLWTLIHDKSSITFRPKQMGAEFKGTFGVFSAEIAFSPADLEHSHAKIDVQLGTAHTGAPDRDENLKGKDWFDVADYPDAIFETKSISKTGDGTYKADGTLTIKNISQPVSLPFKLVIANDTGGKTATLDGTLMLDRSLFQIGTGQWKDTSIIANEVPVDIHVFAVSRAQ